MLLAELGLGPLLLVVALVLALILLAIAFRFANLYVQSILAGAEVGLFQMVAMSLRKVNPAAIVRARITAVQAGLNIGSRDLEAHLLAGGNVEAVVRAMIAADRAGLNLDYKLATGIDLAGRDVLGAVQLSVNPKIIDCPDGSQGKTAIEAVAKDGIQLQARARVTVRTNLARLVGGATEATIIARVGEGIVTTIGASESYKDVLEKPERISKTVLSKGLDAGTSFEIMSIDIAEIDVGKNIGAKLQADQAEADKRVAQARAEVRRAMAVAHSQEMQAKIMENRAKLVLANAEIPRAIADAFRHGRLTVAAGGAQDKPKA
jgi:uncharacterized protein YqfA (UPF0365 family)